MVAFIQTRRYSPLRGLTCSSCGGLRPPAEAFFALRAKKGLFMLFLPNLGHFWCSVVTSVTFSSNFSNFEKSKKNPQKSKSFKKPKKSIKNLKKSGKLQKCRKIQKSEKIPKHSKRYFFLKTENFEEVKKIEKKCYCHRFPILGGRNLPRDLQSRPFQNLGGVP